MVLFFCSFLALRFEDLKTPVKKITDYDLHKEEELFAGSVSASTWLTRDSPHAEVSSMITTSMASDYSGRSILVWSDSRLLCKPVLLKGKAGSKYADRGLADSIIGSRSGRPSSLIRCSRPHGCHETALRWCTLRIYSDTSSPRNITRKRHRPARMS